jgi:hypothetical protein
LPISSDNFHKSDGKTTSTFLLELQIGRRTGGEGFSAIACVTLFFDKISPSRLRDKAMKPGLAFVALLAATFANACTVQQPNLSPPAAQTPPRPLPFSGRLISGDPRELPPAVAMSLSQNSAVTFSYREELSHDEYHIPLWFSWIDPVTYVGAPLGDFGVTAFASLSVIDGDRVLGDYTAKAYVTESYTRYSEPNHMELDNTARAAVREEIDRKLYDNSSRLAQAVGTLPTDESASK